MEIFGFEVKRKQKDDDIESFAPEVKDDGAVVVAAGGSYGTYVDLEGTARSEAELITRYREMSLQPEVEAAIDDVSNEAIVVGDENVVRIKLDNLDMKASIKKTIEAEFEEIKRLLDFEKSAYEIFKRWYIDGRLVYHTIIDEANPSLGIRQLRYIDPRKIRKIREVEKQRKEGFSLATTKNEYYLYSEKGFLLGSTAGTASDYTAAQGLKISTDSILHCTSGLTDQNNSMVLSYLHKAVRPLNQLRVLEDATVIYRITRAPERRIFYIDVGNLPKHKAEQHVRDMMVKHKNRLIYDQVTGDVRDDRKFITMLEDYWFPRREGSKGTEITTLPAGQNLGQMDDVMYFRKKLYQSLYVPINRLDPESNYSLATEISREEIKFSKFITRLRLRFAQLFLKALEKQLVLKKVISAEEWPNMMQYINFEFAMDNYFEELKEGEMLTKRLVLADQVQEFVGKYYSNDFVRRNILRQNDDDIEKNDKQIMEEQNNPIYNPAPPEDPNAAGAPPGAPPDGSADQGDAQGGTPSPAQNQGPAPSIDKFPATTTT
jgi:hypothetical protein